jgi:hypothetical protein
MKRDASEATYGWLRSQTGQPFRHADLRATVNTDLELVHEAGHGIEAAAIAAQQLGLAVRIVAAEIQAATAIGDDYRDPLLIDVELHVDIVRAAAVQYGVGTPLMDARDDVPGNVVVNVVPTEKCPHMSDAAREGGGVGRYPETQDWKHE